MLSALAPAENNLTGQLAQLREWTAGATVSEAAVKAFGEARCFVAEPVPDGVWARMQGSTYRPNPHIGRSALRYVRVLHIGADGLPNLGVMVCNKAIATHLTQIFHQLYKARYPIERMVLPDDYGADDETQMRANNTSCFCYRTVKGTAKPSKHAMGMAVDLNPLYNPYVKVRTDGTRLVQPTTGTPYLNRSRSFPYKITSTDLAYRLFRQHGFSWGGHWKSCKDYQHFEY